MSTLDKILGVQKINFFSMKEQQGFDEAGGRGLGGQVPRLYGGTIFGGVGHTWGVWRGIEHESSIFLHIFDSLEGTRH